MNLRYKVGGRAAKTCLAVFLCLLIAFFFRRNAFYSSIAAVVCMQPTTEKTIKMGLHRFIGTLLGGAAGFVVLECSFHIPYYQQGVYLLVIPVCLLGIIYLCNLIGRKDAVAICCIVFLSIVVNFSRGPLSTLQYATARVVDTTIGILVAMGINHFIFPRRDRGEQQPKPDISEDEQPEKGE